MIDNQTLDQKIDIPTDFLRIHSRTFSKVRRNSFLRVFSMKTNTPFLIMQHGGSGGSGGMAEKFPPLPPFRHMLFLYFMYGFYGFPVSEGIPNPYRRIARVIQMFLYHKYRMS